MLKMGYNDFLENDLNQLFEAFSFKASPRMVLSPQVGPGSSRNNAFKKPVRMGESHSRGTEISEPVTLKQALRGLCISQASEMAAMKRLSKSACSPRVSEAGRIKNLYRAVVVEASESGKGGIEEISLVSEGSTSTSSEKIPQYQQVPRIKWSNQSAQSSPRFAIATAQKGTGTILTRKEMDLASTEVGSHSSKTETHTEKHTSLPEESTSTSSEKMPQCLQVPRIKSPNQSARSSPRFAIATAQKGTGTALARNEIDPTSTEVGSQTSKMELARTQKHASLPSLSCPNIGENRLQLGKVISASTKLANKASAPKPGRKGRMQNVSSSASSINGHRVSKLTRNTPRLVKPVIRNKNFVKKKSKQDSTSAACSSNSYNEVNSVVEPGTSQVVCQRCHCTLKNARKESDQGSPASHRDEVSLNDVNTGVSIPSFTLDSCNRSNAVVKANKNSKSREKGEFSQSSKSSAGEYSSSTSISEESNVSRPSCSNRPHMSKDVRWEAIRHVRKQQGTLGLSHFNLLKKLGCGDIGTVYLAELIGTDCLFAIKVMDNEYLARRKKTPRAQTEREILRMLDHPFLPTLYAQFTADNLSCLVMEYCPGGDLHVLRQKQLGRNFPEQAARFYVAEVLLALEYLHMLGVVYRDLKPENILVREDGHIMLTDFDLSLRCTVSPTLLKSSLLIVEPMKRSGPCTESSCIDPFCIEPSCQVPCFSPRFLPAAAKARKLKSIPTAEVRSLPQLVAEPTDARSNSFVGTHEYLAPEIIKGDGHGSAVDWWTFGIFLYELLYGKTPFKGSGNEETLANVVLQSLKFPESPLVSFQARDLIKGLLVKEPENRLGSERGAAEIKQHPFFEGLNWALIRCAIPPELPEFCDYGVMSMTSQEKKNKYLDYRATGEHLEFELF
ncbi:hypothetical protein L1049_007757 [Liquidambar formosana]|uniref:non-specific serine/threonine protein kinase n=1 Tax=Liquidambar formosana TaxID=63359 RepID=A0AAP0X452_LIQFO